MRNTALTKTSLPAAFALVTLATALPAPLSAQSWTEDERGRLLEVLHASAQDFMESIDGLSEEQWTFKQADDRWSIAEVAEHLALTEQFLGPMMIQQLGAAEAGPTEREGRGEMDATIPAALEDRSQRFQAPDPVQPRGTWATKDELVAAYKKAHEAVTEFVKTTEMDLRAHTAPHPAFGPIDGHQWVLFLTSHVWRHLDQIAEVKADERYPAG